MTIQETDLKDSAAELHAIAVNCFSNYPAAATKTKFHRTARAVLETIRDTLGITASIRSIRGGPAVLGEVVLHADRIYISMGVYPMMPGGEPQILYRSCKSRSDYTGGHNNWFNYRGLALNPSAFIAQLRQILDREENK